MSAARPFAISPFQSLVRASPRHPEFHVAAEAATWIPEPVTGLVCRHHPQG